MPDDTSPVYAHSRATITPELSAGIVSASQSQRSMEAKVCAHLNAHRGIFNHRIVVRGIMRDVFRVNWKNVRTGLISQSEVVKVTGSDDNGLILQDVTKRKVKFPIHM